MARRDWWMGIAIVAFAIIVHAFVSRFEWRSGDGHQVVPVDPQTGRVEAVQGDPQPPSRYPQPAPPVSTRSPTRRMRRRPVHHLNRQPLSFRPSGTI